MALPAYVVATPFTLAAMAVEVAIARRRGLSLYRFEGTLGDLSNSVASCVGQGLLGLSTFALYDQVWSRGALFAFDPGSVLSWLLAFVIIDGVFYWRHRLSHRVALLWAIHEVHHQPHECNLGTAQRLSLIDAVPNIPFALFVALLGVPLPMAIACFAAKTAHSLLTHTQLVGSLGWIERVVVAPSHHRVHHACDPEYLDKNYGSALIVWDRLFGTFAAETKPPTFGALTRRDIDDVWESNVGPLRDLYRKARSAGSVLGGLETLLRPPGWDPATRREAGSMPPAPVVVPRRGRLARAAGFGVALIALTTVSVIADQLPIGARLGAAAGLLALAVAITRAANQPRMSAAWKHWTGAENPARAIITSTSVGP